MFDRRTMMAGGAVLGMTAIAGVSLAAAGGGVGGAARSATGARKLLVVLLRGAADGMTIAAPTGDPGYRALRGAWEGEHAKGARLDGTFTLHPALKNFAALYAKGDALVGHALATSYRERSHFDGQNILESGGLRPYERPDGFLNRFVGLVGERATPALTMTHAVPLVLRGSVPVTTASPETIGGASEILAERLTRLYSTDPQLTNIWEAARTVSLAQASAEDKDLAPKAVLGTFAAQMMTGESNFDVVLADLPGWDTHAGQNRILTQSLSGLDTFLGSFQQARGAAWADTLVAVVTEFGRTAAINGTGGTDHGTGGASLLLGGSIKGGRVVTDWPGLAPSQLYEGRDLKPTNSVEAFLAGAMAEHYGIDPARVFDAMFPGRNQRAMSGLAA